jgi:hypothetical protein
MLERLRKSVRIWNRNRLAARQETRRGQRRQPHRLGLLAIMKNEALNLAEWLEHYRWQGVDKIYLIDNGSTDGSVELLRPWMESGLVELIVLTEKYAQEKHYRTAFGHFRIRDQVEWLMMADVDEFWYARHAGSSIAQALDPFEKYDLIYANWAVYGSDGWVEHPPSLRGCLTRRQPELASHDVTKWICRTDALEEPGQLKVHKVIGVCSSRTVSDNQTFQLNHYVTQSEFYFRTVKMTRGDVNNSLNVDVRTLEYFKQYDAPATFLDRGLADLLERHGPIAHPDTGAPVVPGPGR